MIATRRNRNSALGLLLIACAIGAGCRAIPVAGRFQGEADVRARAEVAAHVTAALQGPVEVRLASADDPGPLFPVPLRAGSGVPGAYRVALVEIDGLILNQNRTGPYSAGENPVSGFRERLEAAAGDPAVRAVVLRINSPGGSATACDILADELRRFREATGKPVVACLMDLGTSGAYYVAVGADRVIAHPTSLTGGIGALFNRYNLRDAMAQFNITTDPIKSAPLVDMGSIEDELPKEAERLLREIADGLAARFAGRVAGRRPALGASDRETLADGRVVSAAKAVELHLVDRLGYLHDALAEAEAMAGLPAGSAEVVAFRRKGQPAGTLYSITPNAPIQEQGLIPISYPGLDRAALPTFLYLWAPDPTVLPRGAP